jgi:predicted ATPase/DNA-binding XRE family transcriptional regulator
LAEVSFGEWLKRRRAAAGWTQEQLAQKIHCSTSALRKFESEERRPSAEVVEQLADIFEISPEEHKSFLRFARGDWQAFGSKVTDAEPWHVLNTDSQSNLPSSISSFIGRENEQSEIINLLKKNRLVTLAGTGGIGKTRIALQVGHQLQDDLLNGVWFVPLDSLSDPALVPQTVASVFEIRASADHPIIDTLKIVLRRKTLLLILDNCEHLLEACAQLITSLLLHCPNLRILTTSRETLNLAGEATYFLPPLSTPAADTLSQNVAEYESVQLFIERAALAFSTFQITEENAQAIVDICRRVEGIPLALELTAARVNILNVNEISKQLHKSFALLSNDHQTTNSRHQTIQASLEWSWSLLTQEEQVFLCQLSVFAGGWSLKAAEVVCDGHVLSLIQTLVQKSLIKVKQEPKHETRYFFHEIVRQFVHGKLQEAGDVEPIRDRHLAYHVKLVEQAEPELYRTNQVYWLNKLDDELDNLRIALQWALATDVVSGLRIAATPWRFWLRRDYPQEAEHWLGQLLERYPTSDSLRAHALAMYSNYIYFRGNMRKASQVAEQGLQLARSLSDRPNEAFSLFVLGKIIAAPGDHSGGAPFFEQSLAIYRALGDKVGQATAICRLAIHHSDPAYSLSLFEESLKLLRELGNHYDIAFCLTHLARNAIYGGDFSSPYAWLEEARTIFHELGAQPDEADVVNMFGILAYWQGDYQQALTYLEQAIALDEKVGNRYWANWPRINMAYALLRNGNDPQAGKYFKVCLRQFQKDSSPIGVVYTIEGLASLYVYRAQPERAVRLLACADAMRKKLGNPRPPVEQGDVDKDIIVCLGKMGETGFSDAYDDGNNMSLEEAVAYALEEI